MVRFFRSELGGGRIRNCATRRGGKGEPQPIIGNLIAREPEPETL
jgi:hypothetical protein